MGVGMGGGMGGGGGKRRCACVCVFKEKGGVNSEAKPEPKQPQVNAERVDVSAHGTAEELGNELAGQTAQTQHRAHKKGGVLCGSRRTQSSRLTYS